MSANLNVRKIMQVSEEAAPALHVPIFVGTECYIITQQDVRRIEDTRFLSYNRICANGTVEPVVQPGGALCYSGENNAGAERTHFDANCASIGEFINYLHAKHASMYCAPPSIDVEMANSSEARSTNVATVEQQLKWSQLSEPKPQFVTQGIATSTSDLLWHANASTQYKPQTFTTSSGFTHVCSRGVNTNDEASNKDEKVQKKEIKSYASQTDSKHTPMKFKKKTKFLCDTNNDNGSKEHSDDEL